MFQYFQEKRVTLWNWGKEISPLLESKIDSQWYKRPIFGKILDVEVPALMWALPLFNFPFKKAITCESDLLT